MNLSRYCNWLLRVLACFDWDLPTVKAVAAWEPTFPHVMTTDNLAEYLFTFIKCALKLDDIQAFEILKLRFRHLDLNSMFSEEFLALDEALDVLEPADVRMIHKDQETIENVVKRDKSFKLDFHLLAKRILVPAAPKAGGKGKGKKGKAGKSDVQRVPVDSNIPHDMASSLMPPGGHVWQNRKGQAWCCHVPPRPRFSEPWCLDTTGALFRIARRAWEQHLQLTGGDWSSCPHIFPDS